MTGLWKKIVLTCTACALVLSFFACATPAQPVKPKTSGARESLPECVKRDIQDPLTAYLFYRVELYIGREDAAVKCLDLARKLDEASTILVSEQAAFYLGQGDLKRARSLTEDALKRDAGNPTANILMGSIYASQKPREFHLKAIEFYEKALIRREEPASVYPLLIQEYLRLGDMRKALSVTRTLLAEEPDNLDGYFFLGVIYDDYFKDYDKALQAYEQVLLAADRAHPNYEPMLRRMAQIYLAREDYESALTILEKLKELDSSDVDTLLKIALIDYELGNRHEAKALFEAILAEHPESDRIHYYLGLLLLEEKDSVAARRHLKKVPVKSEYYVDAVQQLVVSYVRSDVKAWQEAESLARAAVKRLPQEFRFYELLASIYVERGDMRKAKMVWDSAKDLFSGNWRYHYALALYWDRLGEWKNALESMRRVLELDPQNVPALNYIGYTYADRGIELAEALDLLHKANTIAPKNGYVMDSLGWAYYRLKRYAQARRYLDAANRLVPDEGTVLLHLGDLYRASGDRKRAMAFYRRGLDLLQAQSDVSRSREDRETLELLKARVHEETKETGKTP